MFRTATVHPQELLCRYCICRLWYVVRSALPDTSGWYNVVESSSYNVTSSWYNVVGSSSYNVVPAGRIGQCASYHLP